MTKLLTVSMTLSLAVHALAAMALAPLMIARRNATGAEGANVSIVAAAPSPPNVIAIDTIGRVSAIGAIGEVEEVDAVGSIGKIGAIGEVDAISAIGAIEVEPPTCCRGLVVSPPPPSFAHFDTTPRTTSPASSPATTSPAPLAPLAPEYPRNARRRGEHGDVTVEFALTAAGSVTNACVIASCGYPELDDSAVCAVRCARFRPAISGGIAVASLARLTLSFKLR